MSFLYAKGRQAIGRKTIDLNGGDTLKAVLVKSSYVPDEDNDALLVDIASSDRLINGTATVSSPIFTDGTFDCADLSFTSVSSGQTAAAWVLYKDTGAEATSPLIGYFDSGHYTLPLSTDGTDVTIQINPLGVFKWSGGPS